MTSPHPPGSLVVTFEPSILIVKSVWSVLVEYDVHGASLVDGKVIVSEDDNSRFDPCWDTLTPHVSDTGELYEGDDGNDYGSKAISLVLPDGTLHPLDKEPNDPIPKPDGGPDDPQDHRA